MNRVGAGRSVKALSIACECIHLGARVSTVVQVSGLSKSLVTELMDRAQRRRLCGRTPYNGDHLFQRHQIKHLEISFALSTMRMLIDRGNEPAESLVTAYKIFRDRFRQQRDNRKVEARDELSFDRVFDFASRTFGLWGATEPSLVLARCGKCHSDVLSPSAYEMAAAGCPYCRLASRYDINGKIRNYLDHIAPTPAALQAPLGPRKRRRIMRVADHGSTEQKVSGEEILRRIGQSDSATDNDASMLVNDLLVGGRWAAQAWLAGTRFTKDAS